MANVNEIGMAFYPQPLNNIERTFPAFYYKAGEELVEMNEVLDVEQLCLETKIKYAEMRGLGELENRLDEHKEKCVQRGYYTKQKNGPVLVRERTHLKYA